MNEKERLQKHLEYLCSFDKLTGEPEALLAVQYLIQTLEQDGITCHTEKFDAYLSNPIRSRLVVDGEEIPSRPRSFSESTSKPLHVPVVYDHGTREAVSLVEQKAFLETVSGKLVLGYGYDERYAKLLEQYGAAGWVQIWTSGEMQIHEDTVSPVWGTPDMDSSLFQLKMPVLAVSKPMGEKILEKLEQYQQDGNVLYADFESQVDTGVKQVELPVAEIQGKSEDFVLLSCHYDTWYRGAFDNCTADALALELARYFKEQSDQLKYSLRIAWWPGHSNGRYMGSTWYCDHHFDELYDHCIAHVNLDLLGSKGADHTLAIRTAGLEGDNWLQKQVAAVDPEADLVIGRIGRGADQSFWGVEIPYHINPRYEAKKECKTSDAPGPGVSWWHTIEDTFDKIDFDGLMRDGEMVRSLLEGLLTNAALPADFEGYFHTWNQYLEPLKASEEHQEAVEEIQNLLKAVTDRCQELEHDWSKQTNPEILSVCSNDTSIISGSKLMDHNHLCRLVGGTFSRLMHSSGSAYEQDTSFAYGPLQLLSASSRATVQNSPEDWHLFYHTTFIRQRNRMVTELRKLLDRLNREFS